MSLKNEAQTAFKDTKRFYREYVSGMSRESIGRDLQADSARLRELYLEAVESEKKEGDIAGLSGMQKFYRFFISLTRRLNPTRRLIFVIALLGNMTINVLFFVISSVVLIQFSLAFLDLMLTMMKLSPHPRMVMTRRSGPDTKWHFCLLYLSGSIITIVS
jgi:hypothetical protein